MTRREPRFLHRRRRPVATAAVLSVALAACVRQGPPPVGVRALQGNLVFSAIPVPPAPPTIAPPVPFAAVPTVSPGFTIDLGPAADQPVYKLRPPLPAAPQCPQAGPNAYPSQEAPSNAAGLPAAGSYRWKRAGSYQLNIAPGQTFPVAGFDTRLVRNVRAVAADGSEYTFETVQPDFRGDGVVSDWRVKTAALSFTPQVLSVTASNVGDPERGLALEAQTVLGPDGKVAHHYVFDPGVLFVPLPVQPGASFQGVGVDPASGETLEVDGSVDRHERVDACGEILDGWRVTTRETFSGAQSQPATYNFIVATELGAMIIGEHLDTTTTDGHFVLDYTLGQTHPDPLAAGSP